MSGNKETKNNPGTNEVKIEVNDLEENQVKPEASKPEDTPAKEATESASTEKETAASAGEEPATDEATPKSEEAPPEEELSPEEKFQIQAAETADKLLRVMADFDNYKKRKARQYDDQLTMANNRLLGEFLEIVDNFERALEHGNGQTDPDSFLEGTKLIFSQMQNLLARHKVEHIEAVGKPFDPNLHEAMMQIESDEFDEGLVALEVSKGYRAGDRVLRHSKVGVSKGAPTKEAVQDAAENGSDKPDSESDAPEENTK